MALNEIRPTASLESIISQANALLDRAASLNQRLSSLADEVCGSSPEVASQDKLNRPDNGRLEQLATLLELVCIHQENANMSARRLDRALTSSSGETMQSASIGKSTSDRY